MIDRGREQEAMKVLAGAVAASLVLSASLALARDPSRIAPEGAPSSGEVAPADEPGPNGVGLVSQDVILER